MSRSITYGIPDDMFERGGVPITKEEIRAIVISRLRLTDNARVFDIGAGTGSVTVECALVARNGIVFSFEKNTEALTLIRKNCEKFSTGNVVIIEGEAPGTLEKGGSFNRAFIGGSGGNITGILDYIHNNMDAEGRVVVTAITLDTLLRVREFFKKVRYRHDIIQVSVSRVEEIAEYSMFKAINPVFIISADKGDS
jgi:precorrin-6Y C5,15-methyltransferase (decarboxylating) CbiT subunit